MTEKNPKKEEYLHIWLFSKGYEKSCWVNFDSAYKNHVFTYKRSIKLPQGKGCLGYPRPYNCALSPCKQFFNSCYYRAWLKLQYFWMKSIFDCNQFYQEPGSWFYTSIRLALLLRLNARPPKVFSVAFPVCPWRCCRCYLNSLLLFGRGASICTLDHLFIRMRCVRAFVCCCGVYNRVYFCGSRTTRGSRGGGGLLIRRQ